MKTVREVAKELEVSRQTIYSKLTEDFKERYTTIETRKGKETLVIDRQGVEYLKKTIDKPDSQIDSPVDNEDDNEFDNKLIDLLNKNIQILQSQLEVKDTQIVELNERLREAQELNKNNQILPPQLAQAAAPPAVPILFLYYRKNSQGT